MHNVVEKILKHLNKTGFKIIRLFNFLKKNKQKKIFKKKNRTKKALNKTINTKVIRINNGNKDKTNINLFSRYKKYISNFSFKKSNNLNIKNKIKERHTIIKTKTDKKQTYLFTSKLDSAGFEVNRQSKTDVNKFYKAFLYSFSKKSKKTKNLIKSTVGITLLSITIFIVLYSSVFELKKDKIIIERQDDGSNEGLIKESLMPYIGTSIFNLNKEKIKKDILKYQKNINNIEIKRLPLNGIKIIVNSYKPLFKTRFKNRSQNEYLLLENGVLIRDSNLIDNMPILDITSEKLNRAVFLDYEEAVPERLLVRIFLIYEKIFNILPEGLSISKMHYFQTENEIHLTLSNKTILIFDLGYTNTNEVIKGLLKLNEKINIFTKDNNGIIYINLGIMPSIAVCDEGNNCYNNLVRIYGNDYK